MNKRIMAKTMSAVTAVIMAASAMPASVFAADGTAQKSSSVTVAQDSCGFSEFECYEYTADQQELDELHAKTQSYIRRSSGARAAYSGTYDFSMGGAEYPRSVVAGISSDYLAIYDAIDAAMTAFTNNGNTADITADGNGKYIAVTVDISDHNIAWDDRDVAKKLMFTYLYANPQHYWNVNQISLAGSSNSSGDLVVSQLQFPVYEEMRTAEARTAAKNAIAAKIAEYQSEWKNAKGSSGLVDFIHYKMCQEIEYTSGDLNAKNAHTIVGSLVDGDCVCEGYAKAFSLLSNLAGVPSFMVSGDAGGPHAWNLVQLDGSWYYIDATWNDGNGTETYYLCGSNIMDQDHTFDGSSSFITLPENISENYYGAPAISTIDGVSYYVIKTPADLVWFSDQVNSGSNTINGYLENDIDMTDVEFFPIGEYYMFKGIFDGNGKTISNLSLASTTASHSGLFANVIGENTEIKDLTVSNCSFGFATLTRNSYCGAIAGSLSDSAKITNCKNSGSSVTGFYAGGIAGTVSNGYIENCTNTGTVSPKRPSSYRYASTGGGIAGTIDTGSTVKGCVNSGNVTSLSGGICGGIAGACSSGSSEIESCLNTGTMTSETGFPQGGIVGNNSGSLTVSNCVNYAAISSATNSDAVVGYASSTPAISGTFILSTGNSGYTDGENVISLTAAEFKSGEAAWQLRKNTDGKYWGQKPLRENYPTPLSSDKVYKLTFGETSEKYINAGAVSANTTPSAEAGKYWADVDTGYSGIYYEKSKTAIAEDHTFALQDAGSITDYANMELGSSMTYGFFCEFNNKQLEEIESGYVVPEMKVTVNGETTKAEFKGTKTADGKTLAYFGFDLPAKNLGDEMTAQISYDGTTWFDSKTAKASDYLTELYNTSSAEKAIAAATLNYAAQAQIYKGYNTSNLANAGLSEKDKSFAALKKSDLSGGAYTLTEGGGEVVIKSVKLDMLSQTRIRICFELSEEYKAIYSSTSSVGKLLINYTDPSTGETKIMPISQYVPSYDGCTTGKDGDLYYFETTGISPLKYSQQLTFSFMTNDGTKIGDTLSYGVYDYFRSKCESTSSTGIDKLVSAMYAYSKACESYAN